MSSPATANHEESLQPNPPPPPVPPLPPLQQRISSSTRKRLSPTTTSATSLLSSSKRVAMASTTDSNERLTHATKPCRTKQQPLTEAGFQPCYMFFYGSLMDPDVLELIAHLCETPTLQPATITGFRMKMWGPFPTLVEADDDDNDHDNEDNITEQNEEENQVSGMIWKLESHAQLMDLQGYETEHYRPSEAFFRTCSVSGSESDLLDGPCLTFVWAGDPASPDLSDGKFDLALYQCTTKRLMFG